ncbi:MAG: hypothetical protein HKM24_03370 [Gammaproteobacteria bacterium]|nr:hypothetical protein [Gammaproteobacteria bacterium]
MKVAKYWAEASSDVEIENKGVMPIHLWRGSNTSEQEAKQRAQAALRELRMRQPIKRSKNSRYPYGDRPLKEELIDELKTPDGKLFAAITRNSYGALVLNTKDIMFIDIDFPRPGVFARLLQRWQKSRHPQTQIGMKLSEWCHDNPKWGMRVYRTFKGLRVLVTHSTFEPYDQTTTALLEQFGADELYVRLCKNQQSFRARLTPKPWRIDSPYPPNPFPRRTDQQKQAYSQWLAQYDQKSKGRTVCRLLRTLGTKARDRNIRQVIEVHDRYCLGADTAPLA